MIHMMRTLEIPMLLALISLLLVIPPPGTVAESGGRSPPLMTPILVQNVSFSDKAPIEHHKIVIYATLRNNVSTELSNITVHFLVDGMEIGNTSGLQMGINGSLMVEQGWNATKFNHTVSVLVSLDGQMFKDSKVNKDIYVEPEPIGDFTTPVLLVAALLLMIFITVVIPGILERFKPISLR